MIDFSDLPADQVPGPVDELVIQFIPTDNEVTVNIGPGLEVEFCSHPGMCTYFFFFE